MDFSVSIIIPVYNVEAYIEECLLSVAAQTMTKGVECLIIDDCGQDASMILVESFVKVYEGSIFFRVLHHDHNLGLSAARNTGIDAARGEYMFFLDSDDKIASTCIEHMLALAQKHNADLVQGYYKAELQWVNDLHNKDIPSFSNDKKFIKRLMLDYEKNPLMAHNRLVRRNFITEHNLFFREGIVHEDDHWTFFLAKHVQRMAFCKEKTYYYRSTPGSIMNQPNRQKEIYSYQIRLKDFINNIDPIERGEQMKHIFDDLQLMVASHYYESKENLSVLFRHFRSKNNSIESFLFSLWCVTRCHHWLNTKIAHSLIRLYSIKQPCNNAPLVFRWPYEVINDKVLKQESFIKRTYISTKSDEKSIYHHTNL